MRSSYKLTPEESEASKKRREERAESYMAHIKEVQAGLPDKPKDKNGEEKVGGKIPLTVNNINYAIKHFKPLATLGTNEYGELIEFLVPPPWAHEHRVTMTITDYDREKILEGLRQIFGGNTSSFPRSEIDATILSAASRHRFNPVADYMKRCAEEYRVNPETGEPYTVDEMREFLGNSVPHDGTPYSEQVFVNMFTAGVKRTLEPGYKYDDVTVLVGASGTRKTTFCEHLGSGVGGLETLTLKGVPGMPNINTVDWTIQLHRAFIVNIDELDKLTADKRTAPLLKTAVSQTSDTVTRKYETYPLRLLRKLIFLSSTNEFTFLTDPTSTRRWRAVYVTDVIPDDRFTSEWRDKAWGFAYLLVEEHGFAPLYGGWFDAEAARRASSHLEDPTGDLIEEYLTKASDAERGSIRYNTLLEDGGGRQKADNAEGRTADISTVYPGFFRTRMAVFGGGVEGTGIRTGKKTQENEIVNWLDRCEAYVAIASIPGGAKRTFIDGAQRGRAYRLREGFQLVTESRFPEYYIAHLSEVTGFSQAGAPFERWSRQRVVTGLNKGETIYVSVGDVYDGYYTEDQIIQYIDEQGNLHLPDSDRPALTPYG